TVARTAGRIAVQTAIATAVEMNSLAAGATVHFAKAVPSGGAVLRPRGAASLVPNVAETPAPAVAEQRVPAVAAPNPPASASAYPSPYPSPKPKGADRRSHTDSSRYRAPGRASAQDRGSPRRRLGRHSMLGTPPECRGTSLRLATT